MNDDVRNGDGSGPAPRPGDADVLVVGAGPTGLVLALWLARCGIRVRIVARASEPGTTSRALVIHARALEWYRQLGIAEDVVAAGTRMAAANLWVAGRRVVRAMFGDLGAGISRYPFALVFPQDQHERFLIDCLTRAGVQVERGVELLGFEQEAGRIHARLRRSDGRVETCEAEYLAGCDGAHSTVRQALAVGFPGGTYQHRFYVADVDAAGPAMNGELHVGIDRSDFLVLFPLGGAGHARLVGAMSESTAPREDASWSDVTRQVMEWMQLEVKRVHWFSTYQVHHRVVDRFRVGRAFLLGDAAHVHSPVGGQGMNTGIGDAVNLAWKLVEVLRGRADRTLLDSYEPERCAFANRLVRTTDQAFAMVTSDGRVARFVRLWVAPPIIRGIFSIRASRRLLFRIVSQTAIHYRGSELNAGVAGAVRGGERLPWIQDVAEGQDNYRGLDTLDWQVHVYGEPDAELRNVCEAYGLDLRVFPWRSAMARAGFERRAAYLVRPDGHVAMADPAGGGAGLTAYAAAHGLFRASVNPPIRARRVAMAR